MKSEVTFIFSGGRSSKTNNNYANDFFYGYRELKNIGYNVKFIELESTKTNILDKIIIKIFKLPIYSTKALRYKNFKLMKNSKNLVLINESSFLSFLLFTLVTKYLYKVNVIYFPMGLIDKYKNGNFFTKLYIKFSFIPASKILFIGKGELKSAKKLIDVHKNKYEYIPFSIDTNFWKFNKKVDNDGKHVLFIGNDKNRDFNLLYKIAEKETHLKFTIISEFKSIDFNKLPNVNLISGNWREGNLTDLQLMKYYHQANLVILPLLDSSQPSGQSVCLQAMACGTPVIISKTFGFWEDRNYINKKNIYFIKNSNIDNWCNTINVLLSNKFALEEVSINARKLIEKEHNTEKFVKLLKNQLLAISL